MGHEMSSGMSLKPLIYLGTGVMQKGSRQEQGTGSGRF